MHKFNICPVEKYLSLMVTARKNGNYRTEHLNERYSMIFIMDVKVDKKICKYFLVNFIAEAFNSSEKSLYLF